MIFANCSTLCLENLSVYQKSLASNYQLKNNIIFLSYAQQNFSHCVHFGVRINLNLNYVEGILLQRCTPPLKGAYNYIYFKIHAYQLRISGVASGMISTFVLSPVITRCEKGLSRSKLVNSLVKTIWNLFYCCGLS